MNRWIRQRAKLLSLLDRSQRARRIAARIGAFVAARRGADPGVLASAVLGADSRPAIVSAQMIQWAGALEGVWATPSHFRPADQLDSTIADQIRGDRSRFETSDPHLLRQLWSMTPVAQFDEMLDDVRSRLPSIVLAARARPAALNPPALQMRAIETLTAELGRLGAKPFLMSGTLLGVIRDGSPMATDYDVDLGLLPGSPPLADIAPVLSDALGGKRSVEESAGRLVTSIHDVKIDLFAHVERDGRVWHHTDIHEWWNTPFGLADRRVGGVDTLIPDQPETYLAENYGPGWTSPTAFYDMSFDTPNRRYLQSPAALAYLVRRLLASLESGDRWLYERCAEALSDSFDIDIAKRNEG